MLIERCRQLAQKKPPRVVLPDALDPRAIDAARYLKQNGLAEPVLLANPFALRDLALRTGVIIDGLATLDPESARQWRAEFAARMTARLGEKTPPEPDRLMRKPLWFAAGMVAAGKADLCIGGNISSTADVLRAGLKVIGLKPGVKTLSSLFIMLPPNGSDNILGFADCSVVPQPTPVQLADIALSSAETFTAITGQTARVAMLSFSTAGSAKHPNVAAVQQAVEMVHARAPLLMADGELQFDAAFVPSVAAQKAPNSELKGQANIMIFPSLEAGNIGYKIAQRLGGYRALGPIIQGLNAPMHDLSRGCSARDIIELVLVAQTQTGQAGDAVSRPAAENVM